MHYKNGREAKIGDKVVCIPSWGNPFIGILYDATPGNDYCNGKLAPIAPNDPSPNLKECLHLDDALAWLARGEPQPGDEVPQTADAADNVPKTADADT